MVSYSLGNSFITTGDRLVKNIKGSYTLVSWSQRRCSKCHRFLGSNQYKYCSRCSPIVRSQQANKYHREQNKATYHRLHPNAKYRKVSLIVS